MNGKEARRAAPHSTLLDLIRGKKPLDDALQRQYIDKSEALEECQDRLEALNEQYNGVVSLLAEAEKETAYVQRLKNTLRAQAQYIDRLETMKPVANQALLRTHTEIGAANLMRNFAAQRYEHRLGAAPWYPA